MTSCELVTGVQTCALPICPVPIVGARAMTLRFIPQDRLSVSRTNMRHSRKAPDVRDILPTVRKRGVIQTLLVRPAAEDGYYEIVAGARRFHAAALVAEIGRANV